MAKIQINNPRQTINGGAKKYYFKVKGLGGPKGDKGDKGDTGATGPQGPQGNAATVSVGSTTTLPVGYDATVTNSGSIYNAVLDFGIPQGPQGPQGAKGDKGDTGAQGETGPRGPQGEKGTNATVYIGTTTTTNPGTQARVYNSGTDSNAVLNFEIPRGDVGPSVPLVQETGYSTTKAMSQNATTEALNGKQNTLTAGSNIQISGSTISATDTTYTAGNGLNLNGTEFSADTDVLATKEDLESYYTKTETDNLLAPKLEAEVVAELPAAGTEGKLYLTPKAHTTQTATGNPITASVSEEAGVIESFQLDGGTFQQTYTGKNLFNAEAIPYVPKRAYSPTGAVLDWSDYTGTDEYQPVEPNTQYALWNNKTGNTTYLCEYDENKNFIQRLVAVRTFTTTSTTKYLRWSLSLGTGAGTTPPTQTQLELGSKTSYEPFVGGQPSPSPDYPQQIQTVTGEQTVTVAGKNLFDKDSANIANYYPGTGGISYDNPYAVTIILPVVAGETYTASTTDRTKIANTPSLAFSDEIITSGGTAFLSVTQWTSASSVSATAPNGAKYMYLYIKWSQDAVAISEAIASIQVELGSTATDYAPYSHQTLPINLGSIELCKLDTYQDYIWKDGEDWKVHKATGKYVYNDDLAQNGISETMVSMVTPTLPVIRNLAHDSGICRSNMYIPIDQNGTGLSGTTGTNKIRIYTAVSIADSYDKVRQLASANNLTIYYPLDAATDTAITDQTLIAQLEAIRTAALENGANTISNAATGSNLAGDMEIGYYGYNPRNRYDKWLWLDINNEYEQIGS